MGGAHAGGEIRTRRIMVFNEQNRARALRFIEALSANKLAEMREVLHADFEVWLPRPRRLYSFDEYQEMVQRSSALMPRSIDITIGPITAEDDRVAIQCESHADLVSGKTYNNVYHFLFEFHEGKIRKVSEHNDTYHAVTVLHGEDS